jgi:hypothetical protein
VVQFPGFERCLAGLDGRGVAEVLRGGGQLPFGGFAEAKERAQLTSATRARVGLIRFVAGGADDFHRRAS